MGEVSITTCVERPEDGAVRPELDTADRAASIVTDGIVPKPSPSSSASPSAREPRNSN